MYDHMHMYMEQYIKNYSFMKCFILLIIFTKLCPIIFNCFICLQNSLNKKYQKNKHITNKVI